MRLYVRTKDEADLAFVRVRAGVWNMTKNRFGLRADGLSEARKESEIKKAEQALSGNAAGRKLKIYIEQEPS